MREPTLDELTRWRSMSEPLDELIRAYQSALHDVARASTEENAARDALDVARARSREATDAMWLAQDALTVFLREHEVTS